MADGNPDKGSSQLLAISFAVLLMVVITEVYVRRPAYDSFFFISGIILFAIGFVIRVLGQFFLGKQFDLRVRILKDHKLITRGIYNYIRHPMYTGMFMLVAGICVMLQSIFGIVATMILLVPVGIYRTKVEEEALAKKFGKGYRKYAERTKRFVPFLF